MLENGTSQIEMQFVSYVVLLIFFTFSRAAWQKLDKKEMIPTFLPVMLSIDLIA
jgi:hypothetical protein